MVYICHSLGLVAGVEYNQISCRWKCTFEMRHAESILAGSCSVQNNFVMRACVVLSNMQKLLLSIRRQRMQMLVFGFSAFVERHRVINSTVDLSLW